MAQVRYCGVYDDISIKRAVIFLATRDPAGVATSWRPATRATERPCQPCWRPRPLDSESAIIPTRMVRPLKRSPRLGVGVQEFWGADVPRSLSLSLSLSLYSFLYPAGSLPPLSPPSLPPSPSPSLPLPPVPPSLPPSLPFSLSRGGTVGRTQTGGPPAAVQVVRAGPPAAGTSHGQLATGARPREARAQVGIPWDPCET